MLIIASNTHFLAFLTMARRMLRTDGELMLSARGKQVQRLMEITHALMEDFDLEHDISFSTHDDNMQVECMIRCEKKAEE